LCGGTAALTIKGMDDLEEVRRMLADSKWDLTLMFARALKGREEGSAFEAALDAQMREVREGLRRRGAEFDRRRRRD
jgi:hypothetical protein